MAQERTQYKLTAYKKASPQEYLNEYQKKLPNTLEPMDVPTFMDVVSEDTGVSNLDMIWFQYDPLEKAKYEDEYGSKDLPYIKPGTALAFPIKEFSLIIEEIANDTKFLKQQDFQAYWSENLRKLVMDPKYVPDNVVGFDEKLNVYTKVQPLNIRVWIYCKATDSVYDISQYVLNCNTEKTLQNGSFSMVIAPFLSQKQPNTFGGSYSDVINTVTKEGYQVKSFLEKVVQANDIVFLRYERLKLESERDSENSEDILVSPNRLANTGTDYNVWDMIGFVDNATEMYSADDNSKATIIHGRDISKLFAEDGSYFIPLIDVEGSKQHWVYLGRPQDSWYKRNIVTGSYDYLWSYKYKAINDCIWFIINVMSNIGLCKNDLFSSWKDKRITGYEVEGQETFEVKGIWQIVKTYIEPEVQNRVLVDSSIGNPNGTLMEYMNRICQYPFVEFIFDTYINTIDIVVRQPPFTEKAITSAYKEKNYINITADNVISSSLSYDPRTYSWFQIHIQNNNLIGSREQTTLAFVPIAYLNEYAELWGNRKLEVNDIYTMLKTINGATGEEKFVTMQAAILNDLLYVVESNAYLPFTRTGTLEINGDRRIKVGTFVLNEATDEFFYVTSVQNTCSFSMGGIERRTILQVERGMYIPILEGNDAKNKDRLDNANASVKNSPSYFKIVNLENLKNSIKEAEGGNLTTVQSPLVDKAQFDYFLNRKMYGGLV